jgi:aryl-alcohol dehydrogenase-like predicted oxidoreductase
MADMEAGWSALVSLQRAGKVRHLGVSNFDPEQMQRMQSIGPISALQPPYSLIQRGVEREVLPFCQRSGIGVIVYSPMASGLLTGAMSRERIANLPADDWRRRNPEFQDPLLTRNLALVHRLRAIAARSGRIAGEVAIAWTLCHSAVTGAIVGARSAEQASEVFRNPILRLTSAEIAELEAPLSDE